VENNAGLQIRCIKLEKDVHHLRLANAGLEKASEARLVCLKNSPHLFFCLSSVKNYQM
jgi:hypothetical protein